MSPPSNPAAERQGRASARARALAHFDRRIALGFGAVVLLLMVIVTIAGANAFLRVARANEDALVSALTGVLADSVNRTSFSGRYHTRLLLEELIARQPQIAYAYVMDADGLVIAHSNPQQNATRAPEHVVTAAPAILAGGGPIVQERQEGSAPIREILMPYRAGFQDRIGGVIVAGITLDSATAPALRAWGFMGALIAVLTAFTLLVTYVMSRRFAGPVKQLAAIFDGILRRSPVYIGIYRPDGTVEETSANLGQLLEGGRAPGMVEGEGNARTLFRGERDRPEVYEWPYQDRSRARVAMATSFPVAVDRTGAPTLYCAIAADITAQREAEAALREHRDMLEETVRLRTQDLKAANEALSLREHRATELGRLKAVLLGEGPFSEKLERIAACSFALLDLRHCQIWMEGPADRCHLDCVHQVVAHVRPCGDGRCLHLVASAPDSGDGRLPLGMERVGRLAEGPGAREFTNDFKPLMGDGGPDAGLSAFAGYRLTTPGGKLAGIFAAFADRPLGADDEAVLEELATTASYVIQAKLAADELEATNRVLIQRERLATLGELTATVSHELRNPLGTIQASFYLLKGRLAQLDDERVVNALERAARGITRCDRIIEALLDFTREPALHTEVTQLDTWLEAEIGAYPFPEGVHARLDLQSTTRASVDRQILYQCLTNLLNNACDALVEDRDSGKDKPREVHVRLTSDETEVIITVSDTGTGIPRENMDLVFRPLFSTKGFGTGLGLPLVRKLLDLHGGHIEIESQFGVGTTARLTLPQSVVAASSQPRAAS